MKRTFTELRALILRELSCGEQTINELSQRTGINWKTVRIHLDFLAKQQKVVEIVHTKYVRIFKLASLGPACAQTRTIQEEAAAEAEAEAAPPIVLKTRGEAA